ncbi:37639_t:CDS:2, partial [Gigaspora margarita]
INFPVVGQTSCNWDENDDNSGLVEKQSVNISQRHVNTFYSTFNLVKLYLSNIIQTFKRQNHIEGKAAVLLNNLLECKAEDSRWIINRKNKLIIEFSDTVSYLNHALFNEKERWAICYTSKVFNAKMQFIQRVKDQNAIIKNSVNSSTSLINLVKSIDKQIDRASTYIQYKN